ncbi:MAG: O-antigen ligase family protein [Gammaproteobacteria bacterium]
MTVGAATINVGQNARSRLMLWLVGLTLATSSIVLVEPAPYDVLVIALFGGLLVTGLRFPREMHVAALALGLFAIGNVIAAAGSTDPLSTIRSLSIRLYMPLAWCMFVGVIASSPVSVMRVIWQGYQVAAIIAVTWAVAEYYGFVDLGDLNSGLRAKGPFKDANVFAPFLVPVAIFSLAQLAGPRNWSAKLWYGGVFIWLAFGILLSFSRGAWLNFAVASALFSVFALISLPTYRAKLSWLLLNVLVVLTAVGVLAALTTTSNVASRLADRAVLTQKYDVQLGGRFYTQKQAIQKIAETPLGIGPGRSDEEFGLEPHNLFLHVFVEGGWLAGCGMLIFIALSLYRSLALFNWRSPLQAEFLVVIACVIGVLTQSLFIDSTHWRHLWLLLAMLWGLIAAHRHDATTG